MAVHGVKELKSQVRNIKRSVKNATRAAAYAGAVVYRDALRTVAPTTNKTAKKAIIAQRVQVPREGTGVGQVGLRGPAFYLNIISVGAKKHIIEAGTVSKIVDPRTRKIIGRRAKKKLVLGVSPRPGRKAIKGKFQPIAVVHPGLRGRNWIRPIVNANRGKSIQAVGDRYTTAIQEAIG